MAYWDSRKGVIVEFDPEDVEGYPDWELVDCGCCNGLRWGGMEPVECHRCRGAGFIYRNKKSGVRTLYVGGPFV